MKEKCIKFASVKSVRRIKKMSDLNLKKMNEFPEWTEYIKKNWEYLKGYSSKKKVYK